MAMNETVSSARRQALLAGLSVAATATVTTTAPVTHAAEPSSTASASKTATTDQFPMLLPKTEFVYEAIVDIAPPMQLGMSPYGDRRMVPITGGSFEGPELRGKVLSGGADRQLVRRDGSVNLDAIYELQTDDGVVISVRNRVLSRQPKDQPAYRFSTLDITVADGKYGWLNDFVYVGTLNSLRPKRDAVVIRVYKLV